MKQIENYLTIKDGSFSSEKLQVSASFLFSSGKTTRYYQMAGNYLTKELHLVQQECLFFRCWKICSEISLITNKLHYINKSLFRGFDILKFRERTLHWSYSASLHPGVLMWVCVLANCQVNLTECWAVSCDALASSLGWLAKAASWYRNWIR